MSVRVTVWNEYRVETEREEAAETYPDGIHNVIAEFLEDDGYETRTATLDEPEHGLTEDVLEDEVARRVRTHVRDGMGLIVLHQKSRRIPRGLTSGRKPTLSFTNHVR